MLGVVVALAAILFGSALGDAGSCSTTLGRNGGVANSGGVDGELLLALHQNDSAAHDEDVEAKAQSVAKKAEEAQIAVAKRRSADKADQKRSASSDEAKSGQSSKSGTPPAGSDARRDAAKEMTTDLLALWDGQDFPNARFSMGSMNLPKDLADAEPTADVHVFGLQDSGVTLFRTLLFNNFGNKLGYHCGPDDDGESGDDYKPGLWRHANLKEQWAKEPETVRKFMQDNVTALVVIRNPYSWLQMMHNSTAGSRLAHACAVGDDWLTRECKHTPTGAHSSVGDSTYGSLPGLWNQWYDGYSRASEFGFKGQLFVSYEMLVKDPFSAMQSIANFFKISKPKRGWAFPYAELKSRGQQDAADKEKRLRSSKTGLRNVERMQACKRLDEEMQKAHGYEVFDCAAFTEKPPEDAKDGKDGKDGKDAKDGKAGGDSPDADAKLQPAQARHKEIVDQLDAVNTPEEKWSSSKSATGRDDRTVYLNGPHGGSGSPRPEDADFSFVKLK